MDPRALIDLGEAFFERLVERQASRGRDISEPPDEAIKKSLDRHARRAASNQEEQEPCNA